VEVKHLVVVVFFLHQLSCSGDTSADVMYLHVFTDDGVTATDFVISAIW
jgi:hypothetical protein